jgi:hypothetical protein
MFHSRQADIFMHVKRSALFANADLSWVHIYQQAIEDLLLRGYYCGIAFPPLQKLRMRERAAIPQ